jgi:hypothetical protein
VVVFVVGCAVAEAAPSACEVGGASLRPPPGWRCEALPDGATEVSLRLTPPAGDAASTTAVTVLVGAKRVADGALEAEAAEQHAARLRNRAAWGVRTSGGLPKESVRLPNGARAVRFRDRVGSTLGAREQTLTCTLVGDGARDGRRLACAIATAAPEARDEIDALVGRLLGSLVLRTKR